MSLTDTIVVLDTETTGLDPAEGAALLEVAWVVLDRVDGAWRYGATTQTYVESVGDIPAQARAVHHISPADVAPGATDCCTRDSLLHSMLAAEVPGEMSYCAHNAVFDRQFLPELGQKNEDGECVPWLDTLRIAMHLWPDAPAYGNQVLRYHLNAEPPAEMLRGLAPHRALYDAACTAAILLRALERHSPEELLALQAQPVLLKNCRFQKYRGVPWSEVPRDYLRWMIQKTDMLQNDADLHHTVMHYYRQ